MTNWRWPTRTRTSRPYQRRIRTSSASQEGRNNRADLARQAGIDPNFELGPVKTKPSHSDAALQTLKFPDELDRLMGKIVADSKLAEQEMGISTLSSRSVFSNGMSRTHLTKKPSHRCCFFR